MAKKKNDNKKLLFAALAAGAGLFLLTRQSNSSNSNNPPVNYPPQQSGSSGFDWIKLLSDLAGKAQDIFNNNSSGGARTARGTEDLARNGSGAGMASGMAGMYGSKPVVKINPVLN